MVQGANSTVAVADTLQTHICRKCDYYWSPNK